MNDHGHGQASPTTLLGYQSVFAAVANGRHATAAQVLRSLADGDVIELGLICQDVETMIEADQRRRVGERRNHEVRRHHE